MYVSHFDRAADYRRRAENARAMAVWISLNDAKQHLLEHAEHLEALAAIEDKEALKVVPLEGLKPEANFR